MKSVSRPVGVCECVAAAVRVPNLSAIWRWAFNFTHRPLHSHGTGLLFSKVDRPQSTSERFREKENDAFGLTVGSMIGILGHLGSYPHCRISFGTESKHYRFLTFYSLLVTWCTNSLTFNNCTFCPHCIYVFCIYLRTYSDLCHLHHKPIGFYNRDEKCLLRGTNWVFK